jgi:hypothetical protein
LVWRALETVEGNAAPADAPDLEAAQREHLSGWRRLTEDATSFLGLGLARAGWLAAALPVLLEASDRTVLKGDALVHSDVRSDNLGILDGQVRLIDWSDYARGSPWFDRVVWLPSLQREGGPAPWELITDSHGLAPLIAGYWAARAGLPPIPGAHGVRGLQREQLLAALPWAIRELGLPPLDGPNAPR